MAVTAAISRKNYGATSRDVEPSICAYSRKNLTHYVLEAEAASGRRAVVPMVFAR